MLARLKCAGSFAKRKALIHSVVYSFTHAFTLGQELCRPPNDGRGRRNLEIYTRVEQQPLMLLEPSAGELTKCPTERKWHLQRAVSQRFPRIGS